MNSLCKICRVELPLTKSKLGFTIAAKTYCEKCQEARTKIVIRIRKYKDNLRNHYEHLKTEMKVIEKLQELVKLGEDPDARTKELLETGHGYWEKYNLKEFYEPNKQKTKAEVQLAKEILDKEDI